MSPKISVMLAMLAAALCFGSLGAFAEGPREEHHEEAHPAHAAPARPTRAPPPAFKAHAPGVHPQGAHYQNHPVRVMSTHVISRGHEGGWRHWEHPEFVRPAYYWNWGAIHDVSCVAEDSYGDQYPVSEAVWSGFGLDNMTDVEDQALDRCYQESGGDGSCYLATCSHF